MTQRACSNPGLLSSEAFFVMPSVARPGWDSEWLVEVAGALPGATVLDVGTGSGIIAVNLARQGRTVTAIDINPVAIACAQHNAERRSVSLAAYVSDLFTSVGDRYDIIVFNPPFFSWDGERLLSRVVARLPKDSLILLRIARVLSQRSHRRLLRRFLRGAWGHLTEGGIVVVLSHASYEAEFQGLPYRIVARRRQGSIIVAIKLTQAPSGQAPQRLLE